jgi:hypothetical protein
MIRDPQEAGKRCVVTLQELEVESRFIPDGGDTCGVE